MAVKLELANVLSFPWEPNAEASDSIIGQYSEVPLDGSAKYQIVVTDPLLVPGIVAIQNAAHNGFKLLQKSQNANAKLEAQVKRLQDDLEVKQQELDNAKSRLLDSAANSIKSLFV